MDSQGFDQWAGNIELLDYVDLDKWSGLRCAWLWQWTHFIIHLVCLLTVIGRATPPLSSHPLSTFKTPCQVGVDIGYIRQLALRNNHLKVKIIHHVARTLQGQGRRGWQWGITNGQEKHMADLPPQSPETLEQISPCCSGTDKMIKCDRSVQKHQINPNPWDLSLSQWAEVANMRDEFSDVFPPLGGCADTTEHCKETPSSTCVHSPFSFSWVLFEYAFTRYFHKAALQKSEHRCSQIIADSDLILENKRNQVRAPGSKWNASTSGWHLRVGI